MRSNLTIVGSVVAQPVRWKRHCRHQDGSLEGHEYCISVHSKMNAIPFFAFDRTSC
jgi:hypothetical protein